MEKIIFACPIHEGPEMDIYFESIRKFAGELSNAPIWGFTTKTEEEISERVKKILKENNVKINYVEIDPEVKKFPFTAWICSAALAEKLAEDKTEFIAWLDINSFFIQEPKEFLLEDGKNLGYRPVHHTLIGSKYDEPLDPFWKIIYSKLQVTDELVFPMQTHIDGNTLRPYINSGFMVIRPKKGLLRNWWENYKKMYNDPIFQDFYKKDDLYITFIHQAVLSALILTTFRKEEMHEFPFDYNYPLNLYDEIEEKYKADSINDLVHSRIYIDKLLPPEKLEKFPITGELKKWLAEKLSKIQDEN